MAYDTDDPRSQLATDSQRHRNSRVNVAPQCFEFDRMTPTPSADGSTEPTGGSWLIRSQAAVVGFDRLTAGEELIRTAQIDEYVVLVPEAGAQIRIEAAGGVEPGTGPPTTATGPAIVIVPPGPSRLTAPADTTLVRLFSTRSDDLNRRCANADFYATPDPNVAPFEPWPDPPAGLRVRVYPIDGIANEPGRFGRIFRCCTFMVNWLPSTEGPRDPTRMSPHHHDDFEQLSLQLAGDYVHHIRTPWGVDSTTWRDDQHLHCASPSVTIIPPPSIHTSEAVGQGHHQLIDIFAPPRFDFSERPGWVLNADDYPAPGR